MKFRLEVDGQEYRLELQPKNGTSTYLLKGETEASGSASVAEVMPGVFSILLGAKSFTVHVAANGDGAEAVTSGVRRHVSIADARDRSPRSGRTGHAGPVDLRAQMPGKVVKVLIEVGATVEAGQGLVIVEAMKMQNELKAPKAGTVARITAVEGMTVAAGESLVIVE